MSRVVVRVLYVGPDPRVATEIERAIERRSRGGPASGDAAPAAAATPAPDAIHVLTAPSAAAAREHLDFAGFDCVLYDADDAPKVPTTVDAAALGGATGVPIVATIAADTTSSADTSSSSDATDSDNAGRYDRLARKVLAAIEHRSADRALPSRGRPNGAGSAPPESGALPGREGATRDRQLDRYRLLVETVGDPMYVLDEDGVIVMANRAMAGVHGYDDAAAIVGRHATAFISEAGYRRGTDLLLEIADDLDRACGTFEMTLVSPDGGELHAENKVAPFTDEDGQLVGSAGVIRDIEARVERERQLEQYRMLVETVGDPMYVLDEDGHIAMPNRAMAAILGYDDLESVRGKHVSEYMPAEDVRRGTELLLEIADDPDRDWDAYEMTVLTPDGDEVRTENKLAPLTDDDGRLVGSVGVIRDIEARVERERELRARERELTRQNKRLDRFASVVSHDLRNPLAVAKGYVGFLDDTDDVAQIRQSLDRMETIIEDVLELARQGATVVEPGPVSLAAVADRAWDTVDTGDASLVVADDAVIRCDESRFAELLENLFRNAIQHGDPRGTVRVAPTPDGFVVDDDGPGITPDDRDQVLETGYTTAADGTGFGLSIVAEIADAHGWTVNVGESDAGGARFAFTGVERADQPA